MKLIIRAAAAVFLILTWGVQARGAKYQYRSVGPGNTSALASGSPGNPLQISAGTADFYLPLSDKIGVGDVLTYDSNNDGALDKVAFIRERASSTTYGIQDVLAAAPSPLPTPTTHWVIQRAYTSLNSAVSGIENAAVDSTLRDFDAWIGGQDLAAQDEIWTIACYGDNPDVVPVAINGWTTDQDHYLRIFTPALPGEVGVRQRHRGVWDDAAYALTVSDNTCLSANISHLRVEGLQFRIDALNNASRAQVRLNNSQTAEFFVSGCLFAGSTTYWNNHTGLTLAGTSSPAAVFIWNNIFYGFKRTSVNWVAAANLDATGLNALVCNNTFCDNFIGLYQANGNVTAINNLAQTCGDGFQGTFSSDSDYNLSDLAGDAPGPHAKNLAVVAFVDPTGFNYHLSSADTVARDQGADLSAYASLPFSQDIDGETRVTPWDIGADEYLPTVTVVPTASSTPTPTPDPSPITPSATFTPTQDPMPYTPVVTPTLTPAATSGAVTATPTPLPTSTVPTHTRTATAPATHGPSASVTLSAATGGRVQIMGNVLDAHHPAMPVAIRLERPEHLRVRIYNQRGERQAVLLDEIKGPGRVDITWQGADQEGRPVPSGVYLLHIQADSFDEKYKIAVVR